MKAAPSSDLMIHLELYIVPPLDLKQVGVKGDKYTRDVKASDVGTAIAAFVQQIVNDTRILEQRGSLVVNVEALPERKLS